LARLSDLSGKCIHWFLCFTLIVWNNGCQ
jgi:hypothetical protein